MDQMTLNDVITDHMRRTHTHTEQLKAAQMCTHTLPAQAARQF